MNSTLDVLSSPRPIGDYFSDILAAIVSSSQALSERQQLFEIIKENDHRRWGTIRLLYSELNTDKYLPYPINWKIIFTPIESAAWGEIRYLGLPFWPQFPIGKYFADFADPIKKIVIECDGAAFHSHAQDAKRDAFMAGEGWSVYRISGADCKRILKSPWEEIGDRCLSYDDQEADRLIYDWLHTTVDGLIAAVAFIHFARPYDKSEYFKAEARRVLQNRLARITT